MNKKHPGFWLLKGMVAWANWTARSNGTHNLKLLIVGSSKTGNHWLRKLLAEIYGLPEYNILGMSLNEPQLPPIDWTRFVAIRHYRPRPDLLEWGQREGVQFLTMLRHPADQFVSLYHFVNNFALFWKVTGLKGTDPAHVMIGENINSPRVLAYLRTRFKNDLRKSLAWLQSGQAWVVRYENLQQAPVETLKRLTDQIEPVERTCIEQAVNACHIDKMRRESKLMRKHYREGKVGGWQHELNQAHITILRECYAQELALLGYELDDIW